MRESGDSKGRVDMSEERVDKLLNELGERITEPAPPALAEKIKSQIPHRLALQKGGMDTINIIIHLKINKLTAAAAIIVTIIVCLAFFGRHGSEGDGLYEDLKELVGYLPGAAASRSEVLGGLSRYYRDFVSQGRDVVYYGESVSSQDGSAILMHWRLADGRYRVIFGDLHVREVTAEELIQLQAQMLLRRTK